MGGECNDQLVGVFTWKALLSGTCYFYADAPPRKVQFLDERLTTAINMILVGQVDDQLNRALAKDNAVGTRHPIKGPSQGKGTIG